ncbi:RloB family protein [Acerihabitans sp. TG2]|uniref:RloB family protein n=1 Tax=Acerihabitans sp. TG2 TaxID=3096008 RepID=UPI002B2370FB|nr:RloB family protein [Acerihabitans sp. TG2]MEA9390411.1 RloB family protein [Acerihabitans sp. TG2]
MGSDDLFHKRRPKSTADMRRKKESKISLDKILIVCEGEKTEPIYFTELREFYELNTTNVIEVIGNCGSSPSSVVAHAKNYTKNQ